MLRLGARVFDTRFRPAVVAVVDDAGAAGAAFAEGADAVELPGGATDAQVASAAVDGPVVVTPTGPAEAERLVAAGASLLLARGGVDDLPDGPGAVTVLAPAQVLDLVGAGTAELCARIAASPGSGACVVRTTDPRSARRAADLVETLGREAVGVFP